MKPIHLELSVAPCKLATGASCFWGNPDLPKGFIYPTYIDKNGDEHEYIFVCQINLEELDKLDVPSVLPKNGLLSFFAKIGCYISGYGGPMDICSTVSDKDAVRVLYFPSCDDLVENVLLDDMGNQIAFNELQIEFSKDFPPLSADNSLFAFPDHLPWETWDPPFEDWEILLQVDSYDGEGFYLNFMDCGVLDLLISPTDLKNQCFDNVRAIVLSS